MIPISHRIQKRGVGFSAQEWREILKKAWELAGEFWHSRILPEHFTRAGAEKYGYQPRSKRYMRRKAARHHHQTPLVYTGYLQQMVQRWQDVRPTAKGANVYLHGPTYLFQYRKDVNAPDKAAELSKLVESDARLIANEIDKTIDRLVKSRESSTTAIMGNRESGLGGVDVRIAA